MVTPAYKITLECPPRIYRHGKAYLSKQPPWRAAGDPRLARGRSRVRALAPAGTLRMLFSPPSLPSSFGRKFFRTFSTNPAKVLGLLYTTSLVHNNPNTLKSYQISQKNAACGVAQLPNPIYRHGKVCLSTSMACSWGPSPSMPQVPGSSPRPRRCTAHTLFPILLSFLLREIVFFCTFPTNPPTPQRGFEPLWCQISTTLLVPLSKALYSNCSMVQRSRKAVGPMYMYLNSMHVKERHRLFEMRRGSSRYC